METFIKEWSDIQNIVIEKEFYKFILDELRANEQDVCELLDSNYCERTMHCILYKNKCVSKDRIQPIHKPSVTITSSTYKIKFEVIDSMYLGNVQLTTTKIDLYYCMVRSTQTNVIYILFSSGIVLTKFDLQENRELNDRLHILIGKIIKNKQYVHVLAGHSMRCVLSLYTGYLLFFKYNNVFTSNIFVLGSAGAKWMFDENHYVTYTNLPNIKIFLSGELRHSKSKCKMLLDCYTNEGFGREYRPLSVIYKDTNKENGAIYETLFDDIKCQIEYPDKNNSQCQKFHQWAYYKKLLQTIYKDVFVSRVISSRAKSKPRRSKTEKSKESIRFGNEMM